MPRIAADAVLLLHAAFVLFVVLGWLAAWRWPPAIWLHVPAVAWAAFIELSGGICPLTPLEVALRREAGQGGYTGDFIDHYVTTLLYPQGLTREIQTLLGVAVVLINVVAYGVLAKRRRRYHNP